MAVVAPGAGALSLSKPITNNDLMESLQLPGIIKASYNVYLDSTTAMGTSWSSTGIYLGAFGYTQVVDDIIIQVAKDWAGHGAGEYVYVNFGVASPEAASSDAIDGQIEDADYFTTGSTTSFKIDLAAPTSANAEGALYSVLRGTPAGTVWASTADEVAKRTFGPGRPAYLADGVTANTMTGVSGAQSWTKPVQLVAKVGGAGAFTEGQCLLAVRTHYTDVDFGAGL